MDLKNSKSHRNIAATVFVHRKFKKALYAFEFQLARFSTSNHNLVI